jgi:hypothetical protein
MFYLDLFVVDIGGWLAAVPIILSCPLMVSGYKSYKTTAGHALAGLVVVGVLVSSALTIAGVI